MCEQQGQQQNGFDVLERAEEVNSVEFRSGGVHWDSEASMTYGVRTACEFSETTLYFPVARSKHSLRVCFGCRSGPRRRMHRRRLKFVKHV